VAHFCQPAWAQESPNVDGHEAAVTECSEDDGGALWVGNEEGCGSRVNFCPFCGYRAPAQVTDS
jgi:hypothetical protein